MPKVANEISPRYTRGRYRAHVTGYLPTKKKETPLAFDVSNNTAAYHQRTSQDRREVRLGEQRGRSNALGLEYDLVRRVRTPLLWMQRSRLSIIATKVLPVESTPPQPQRVCWQLKSPSSKQNLTKVERIASNSLKIRREGEAIYRDRKVVTSNFTATAWRPSLLARIPTGEKRLCCKLLSEDLEFERAQPLGLEENLLKMIHLDLLVAVVDPVKIEDFVHLHSTGLAYICIITLKKSRLRSTLSFSVLISAAVVALDRRVSVHFDRQSIVTKKYHLQQYLPIKVQSRIHTGDQSEETPLTRPRRVTSKVGMKALILLSARKQDMIVATHHLTWPLQSSGYPNRRSTARHR
ncbi:hypothetical protein EVAR_26625_1 [Eumeta japonica]|uniref:Uncharacterized protein n=1 Tax=Eumeta variegata TaxID=151549 RepID=A0A4C1XH80_EUMVA|nr:hypothetical protein EVAR_26625_1 [Eumeta japonica]